MTKQELVDIGGRRLCRMVTGTGSPAVLFEAGAGDSSTTWRELPGAIAQFTQVFTYDRAGLGPSDPVPRPRTALQMVDDLRKLVKAVQIEEPYVLVGHSLGALISRLYAQEYPQDVVGMVLIDGPHPDQGDRFTMALTAAGYSTHEAVQAILKAARGVDPETHPEGLDFAISLTQVDPTYTFGDMPLVIITSGKSHTEEDSDLPLNAALVFDHAWHEMQANLARLSTRGVHKIAKKSGHYIHWDEPEIVVNAILQLIETVRKKISSSQPY